MSRFNGAELTRNLFCIIGLAAVVGLAFFKDSPEARGALLTLLAAAVGYLFRGRVENASGHATAAPKPLLATLLSRPSPQPTSPRPVDPTPTTPDEGMGLTA